MIDLNEDFLCAINELKSTNNNCIFITGKAGTGKSTLIDYYKKHYDPEAVILAPTGVSAINVRGQTIHNFFNYYIDVTPEKIKLGEVKPRNLKLIKSVKTIIIDEISMVRADLLDSIEATLSLYGILPFTPFGGVKMIFVGDIYQLPPVLNREDRAIFLKYYQSPYFFSAKSISSTKLKIVELKKIYRQKDQYFIEILNKVRNNSVSYDDINKLNERYLNNSAILEEKKDNKFHITLTANNKKADFINKETLSKISGKSYISNAKLSGNFTKEYYPTDLNLEFKIGAQIMLLNNDSKKRWVNGSIAEIIDYDDDNDEILINIEGKKNNYYLQKFTWEIFKYEIENDKIISKNIGSFSQFPFKLAWAITIHKSQGKTFKNVVIDTDGGIFLPGQLYVALSRCTSLEGIVLKNKIQKSDIKICHHLQKIN